MTKSDPSKPHPHTIELFSEPASPTPEPKITLRRNGARKAAKAKPIAIPGQGYLPGLSRRGRPRSEKPVPPVERATLSRAKRLAAGVKRIELMLLPEVAARLDALAAHHGETRAEAASRAILLATRRLDRK